MLFEEDKLKLIHHSLSSTLNVHYPVMPDVEWDLEVLDPNTILCTMRKHGSKRRIKISITETLSDEEFEKAYSEMETALF